MLGNIIRFGVSTLLLAAWTQSASAQLCDEYWLHMGGVSKHIEIYTPNVYTKYRRQTHPGFGLECKIARVNAAGGQFINSIDHEFSYASLSKDIFSVANIRLFAGVLVGQYGRDQGPLNLAMPMAYLEYRYQRLGINLFALPPAHGWNDYLVLFAQIKLGF